MPNLMNNINFSQEQMSNQISSILKQKTNPNSSINDMLVQYFIHKEFMEP
jgi:hypothetical protein